MAVPQAMTITDAARAAAPISAATIVGVMAFTITICTVFTITRLTTRLFVQQQLWWDDWTMFLAWIGTIILCLFQVLMIQHGAGLNIWDVPKDELDQYLKLFVDVQMIARLTIFFARLSILLMYIRLFFPLGTFKTPSWWVIQAVIWLNLLYTVSLILVLNLQCVPYHLPWGSSSCVNQWLVLVLASVINIISDIAVLVVPIASIVKLRTTRRKKWAIWALFAFGALAPLASVARLGYQVPVARGQNKTVIYPIVLILATAEQAIAMIVGSAPVVSGALIRIARRRKATMPGRRRRGRVRRNSNAAKSMSQRLWPARESVISPRVPVVPRTPDGVRDPYPLTNISEVMLSATSTDVLYPPTTHSRKGRHEDDEALALEEGKQHWGSRGQG
ncbi:hypothetical protein F5Y17DRAFT_460194 [Xylariaceae sp. FL0594]|nr:hypothetical protein F5Y17DRAFT_460194 [Xylariaceae sp. FL0594]